MLTKLGELNNFLKFIMMCPFKMAVFLDIFIRTKMEKSTRVESRPRGGHRTKKESPKDVVPFWGI